MVRGPTDPGVTATPGVLERLQTWFARRDLRHSVVMFATSSLANALDYAFNVVIGRLLSAEGYGIMVALQAMLRIVAVSLEIVRTVTARYIVGFTTRTQHAAAASFLRTALRQAVLWGIIAALLVGVLSSPLARLLQIPTIFPVVIAAASLLPLFVKPVLGGALQGLQRFVHLGWLQAAHSAFRLVLGFLFVSAGLDAVGAMAALPVGTVGTILLGLLFLQELLRQRTVAGEALPPRTGLVASLGEYAGKTSIGLISLAVLVNMDALVVKHYALPLVAGQYSMAVTLGKIVLFVPVAFAQVLFPMSAERYERSQDSSRLLRLSQGMTLLPCTVLTAAFFAFPDLILQLVFDAQNPFDGPVLGMVALAMSGYALVNVWLNYYLSIEQAGFAYTLLVAVVAQAGLLLWFHDGPIQVASIVAATSGLLLVLAELWFRFGRSGQSTRLPEIGSG